MCADTFLGAQGWLSLQRVKGAAFSSQRSFLSELILIVPSNEDPGKLRPDRHLSVNSWERANYRQPLSRVLELRAKFRLVAKFSPMQELSPIFGSSSSATFVGRHCNMERRIKYVTSIVRMFSTPISSTKPILPQVSNLKCHRGLLWAPRLN